MICWLSIETIGTPWRLAKRYANESKSHHDVRPERGHLAEVRVHVGRDQPRSRQNVLRERPVAVHAVVHVPDREALDLDDVREALREEAVRAAADDDLHLVAARDEVLAHDLAARRVAHALADDAVENSHGGPREPVTRARGSTR
jgi:hypothetical protein